MYFLDKFLNVFCEKCNIAHFPLDILRKRQHILRARQQPLPRFGESGNAVSAHDKADSELFFERRQTAADGGMADIKVLRCAAYVLCFRDLGKNSKLFKLHILIIKCIGQELLEPIADVSAAGLGAEDFHLAVVKFRQELPA